MGKAPLYVWMGGPGGTALRLEGNRYTRDAGAWYVEYKWKGGELRSHRPGIKSVHDKLLVECTEEEWRKDNARYL